MRDPSVNPSVHLAVDNEQWEWALTLLGDAWGGPIIGERMSLGSYDDFHHAQRLIYLRLEIGE